MSEQKRYTAQEMREMADCAEKGENCKDLAAMLRQAADAEEENAQLKALLEAVVKDNATMTDRMLEVINLCNRMKDDFSSWNQVAADFAQKVLRAARGEGGTE